MIVAVVLLVMALSDTKAMPPPKAFVEFAFQSVAFNSCGHVRSGVVYNTESHALCVRGRTDPYMEKMLSRQIDDDIGAGGHIRYVVVSGGGGDAASAIRMGRKIHAANLDVVVGDSCASTCAQFLFIAGNNKYILASGVVAFRDGTASNIGVDAVAIPPAQKQSTKEEGDQIADFYRSLHVDLRLLAGPPVDIRTESANGREVSWSWKPEKLQSFGVTKVHQEVFDNPR